MVHIVGGRKIMDDREYWFRKRMEDVPMPRVTGRVTLTEEKKENGRKILLEMIEESKKAQNKKES